MTIAQSEFQFIYRVRPLSLFLFLPRCSSVLLSAIGTLVAHLQRVTHGADHGEGGRVVGSRESPFARIIKRDHRL